MNERIKELIERATTHYKGGLGTEIEIFDIEKFAKLIIRECADIATIHQQNHAHDSIGRYVLDHFGVEE